MSSWDLFPSTYRQEEVRQILNAVQAGECVSVIGLSGSGKSNLMGFIHHRADIFPHPTALIDCNRLREPTLAGLVQLIIRSLGGLNGDWDDLFQLDALVQKVLDENNGRFTLLLDRFEIVVDNPEICSNLRALRDLHKYTLTYGIATRRTLDPHSELAELFFAHTHSLGPLSESDTHWNVTRYAQRLGAVWDESVPQKILELTRGYPSLLKAVCEAYAGGIDLDINALRDHPAILSRLREFWSDDPSSADIRKAGLEGLELLERTSPLLQFDPVQLTEKEYTLLGYFQDHPNVVCTKDELVCAVWPEDVIFERGVRDDSLAQLVRRLRVKIELDPSAPKHILTVPGRGYRFLEKTEP